MKYIYMYIYIYTEEKSFNFVKTTEKYFYKILHF